MSAKNLYFLKTEYNSQTHLMKFCVNSEDSFHMPTAVQSSIVYFSIYTNFEIGSQPIPILI